jgi:acyl transferase domain-containing protein
VVLLKRLADAVADGDTVLAVIKGTAINNDGEAKVSYAAPSVDAQASVIAMAQAAADVDPESISYIEAHGTGTPLGDPIELAALTKAFRDGGAKRNGYCAIGTAKTNISHLDIASGATGLIKTVLQLHHGLVPPLLHFKSPNPKIDFARSPFFPVTEKIEWKRGNIPRRAGVSAFGVGGTNAHVIVEEAPEIEAGGSSRSQQLLLLSAKTEIALKKMSENLATHLLAHPEQNLSDVAFTLKVGRKSFVNRRALVVSDIADAVGKLQSGDAKQLFSAKPPQSEPSVVFVFPGQGAQFVEMGRGLYESEPVFQKEVDRCAEILRSHLDLDIRSIMYPATADRQRAESQINETAVTQPAIFTVEYALAKLWLSWGVKPAVLIGHSIGEYVAAVLAESFTLENALALLSARAKLMQALPGGSMLAVRLDGKTVEAMLPPEASIAALNSAKLCTISGPDNVLKSFQSELEANKIASRFLATSHAFHSAMMEPMVPKFTEIVRQTPRAEPIIPWVSTCTGTWIKPGELADPSYWSRQLRYTVRFAETLDCVLKDAPKIILEVGPGHALAQLAHQYPEKSKVITVCSTLDSSNAPGNEQAFVLNSLGKLWLAGVKPDWTGFYANEKRRRIQLPTYPFERKRHWVEPVKEPDPALNSGQGTVPANGARPSMDPNPAGDATITAGLLENVIHQQLRLMTEQLEMLQTKESV